MADCKLWWAVHGLLAVGASVVAEGQPSVASKVHSFHIPAEDGQAAVRDIGLQSGVAIISELEDVKGKQFHAVSGTMTVDAALRLLLAGTGLQYSYTSNGQGISLTPEPTPVAQRPVNQTGKRPETLPAPGNAAQLDPDLQLEKIVVTAQRREQSLQDVPISAQVFQQQVLAEQNINSLNDLSETVPSIHVGSNSRSANLYIRGTGSGESQNFDQSVGLFSDDIYQGRARVSDEMFLDLDRVEVLKGPQTTFFGNNAIAGAFNIVTNKPTDEFEGFTRELYGEDGQYAAEAAVGGPIAASLSARVALMTDGMTGWLHNETIDRDVPGENNVGGRLTLLFKPSSGLDIALKIEGSKNRNVGSLALQDANCPPPTPFAPVGFCKTAISLGIPVGLTNNNIAQNSGQQILLNTGDYVLTINSQKWGQTFTSVSGYYGYHFNENEDTDGTPLDLLNIQEPEKYHQFSQELRVTSPMGQTLEYFGGLYFQTDRLSFGHDDGDFFLTPTLESAKAFAQLVPYLPLGQDMNFSQPERSYSLFGAATVHLADTLRWSAGLRASWVNKSYDWNLYYGSARELYGAIVPLPPSEAALAQTFANAAGLGVANTLSGSRDDHGVMPSTQVQYDVTPSAMAYFSYSRGWKAGGFNGSDTTGVPSNLPFAPEHVNAYEVGIKSEPFDHRVRLNLDVFRSNYTDLQVATNVASNSGAIFSLVRNAASSRTQGVELEGQWFISKAFRIIADVTYNDSRYISYPNVSPTQLQQLLGAKTQDLSGNPTEFAPTWSETLTGSYTAYLPCGYRLTTNVTGIFSSSYFLTGNDDPTVEQGSYGRLDGRMSLATADERWALDVIGKNLTNRDILTFGIAWPASLGSTWLQKEEPRNVAVQVRFRW